MDGRILIIDDEKGVRRVLERLVERCGFAAESVATVEEAQAKLAANGYDLAIVDLLMPEHDGFELLEWMQNHVPSVVAIVLSGTTSVKDACRAIQSGAYDLLTKPIEDVDLLRHRLNRALDHKRLVESRDELLKELAQMNIELESRLKQLETAYQMLKRHASAMQLDLNRAMWIQRGLLPRNVPFPERLSFSVVFRPASKVGGDLYDVFKVDGRRVGLYVADISGHGVSAAMLTVFLKHAVGPPLNPGNGAASAAPSDVLVKLNKTVLSDEFHRDMFISMVYLLIDVETGEVSFANAGHPPVLIRRASGEVERLRLAAPALGIDPDCRYPQSSFRLEHQDTIILHTDGVTDVRNPSGGFFGLPRLQRAVEISQPHADIITRNIETQLDAFAQGRALPDDVTVVALCAEPQREPVESEARVSEPLPSTPMPQEPGAGQLMTRIQSDRRFVVISGPGTWREAQRLLDLSNHAKGAGLQGVVLDLSQCTHLDSTFLGVLHDIVRSFSETDACIFEIQNIPRPVLNEITQLGLTDVLAHFRIEAVPLPESMRAAPETMLRSADMGRLLLRAHEALVEADPRNADRFAAVLDVLRQQARLSETAVEETEE